MTTAIATPAEAAAPAASPTTRTRKPFKRPTFGLVFALTFLGLLIFMAIFADWLPFLRYPDTKVLVGGKAGPLGAPPRSRNRLRTPKIKG